jgi:ribosomal subunit interface protein
MISQQITFKFKNTGVDGALKDYATEKLSRLDKFVGGATTMRAEIEFEKIVSHKSGALCRAEATVFVDGATYRSVATEVTFEAALDVTKDELSTELSRAHERKTSLVRRGGRKIKDLLRFGK